MELTALCPTPKQVSTRGEMPQQISRRPQHIPTNENQFFYQIELKAYRDSPLETLALGSHSAWMDNLNGF
jgi:hypothetical protein